MLNRQIFRGLVVVSFSFLLLYTSSVSATPMEPNVIMTITATVGARSATLDFDTGIAWSDVTSTPNMLWEWDSPWMQSNPMELNDGNGVLAEIQQLSCGVKANPTVTLGFAVTAGSSDTVFTISSDIVSFSSLVNPEAYATTDIGITESDFDTATLTGAYGSGKAYRAMYNMGPTVWADLVDGIYAGSFDSNSVTGRRPGSGTEIIGDTLTSIRSQFHFTLSDNDQASGSSTFDVIPEPATIALLGLGGMVLRKRRKT